MAELEQNIVEFEMPDIGGEPEPKLKESDRKRLDSIVQKMISNKETDDAINMVVSDFKSKYAVKPLVQKPVAKVEPGREAAGLFGKQPGFGRGMAETNKQMAPVTPSYQMPQVTRRDIHESRLIGNAKISQENILKELAENDDVVENRIRQRRFEKSASDQPLPTSDMPQTSSALSAQMLLPRETKPQDLPVMPEDMEEEKLVIEQDEQTARNFLQEVGMAKPAKRRAIEKSVYLVDAVRNVQQDPNAAKRLQKINTNSDLIEKGELTYDVRSGKLIRPQGVVGSLLTGWEQKSKLFDDYDFLNNKSDEEIITELERRRTEYDPDDAIAVPKHRMGEFSQMIGSMPVKSIIAGAATAMIPGAQEAAPFVAGAVGAADFYRMGYAASLQNTYQQLRDEGKSETEALAMARDQAQKEAAIDAAVGGGMSFMGTRFGAKTPAFSPNYIKSAATFLKGAGKEGAFQSVIGAGGEVGKNVLAQKAGINRATDENVLNVIEANFLMTVGMAAAAKAGRGIATRNYKTLLNGLSKVNKDLVESNINSELKAGRITDEQAATIRREIDEYRKVDDLIPADVTEEARLEIQKNIAKRDKLKSSLETQHEAFHPAIKEKIKAIDEQINSLAQQKEPKQKPEPSVREAQRLVEDALMEGEVSGAAKAFMEEAVKDPAEFSQAMKDIADQARDPNSVNQTHEIFGTRVVEKALEMFPLEEKKSSISVIMPGEQKQTETITIKPKQDAVSEQITDEVPVRQAPEAGGEMEGQIRGAEELAGKEGGESGFTTEGQIKSGTIPPNMYDIPVQPEGGDVSSLEHAATEEKRADLGLPDREQRVLKTDAERELYAEQQIRKGYDVQKLVNRIKKGHLPTDDEHMILTKKAGGLEARLKELDPRLEEYENVMNELTDIYKAAEKGGSELGAAFRARRSQVLQDYSLGDMFVRKQSANAEKPLTPTQRENVAKQNEKIAKAKKSLSEKGKEIADRIRSLRPKTDSAQSQFFGLPVAVYDTAIITIAEAVEQGAKLADAIQRGIEYVKANGGFKNKNEERNFIGYMKGTIEYDERLQSFKTRTQSAAEKLKQKTNVPYEKAGQLDPEPKAVFELDEEARQIRKEYRKAKYEFELELQNDQIRNSPAHKKAFRLLVQVGGLPRTLQTIVDFSAVLRQAIIPTITHPTLAAKALPEMFKQTFSKARFDEWLADLKDTPFNDVIEKSKLYISDPNSLHLSTKEENFLSANLAEKIPWWGEVVKASERAYVSYLNKMRVDLFKQGVEVFMNDGKTIENSPELYEGLANFINNATGRGKLGPLEGSADFLNTVFFSPRLMASRMNMLGLTDAFTLGQKGFYTNLPKEVRVMAIKDMLKFIAFGTTVLALSKLAGAEVEPDPRSTDFGKIKIGNTRYDIWGGFQPYARVLSQMATAQSKTGSGNIKELEGKEVAGKGLSFMRGKLAPVPSSAIDLMVGENIVGEPASVGSEALESAMPMIFRDVHEAMQDKGVSALFSVGVPTIFGVGVNTYESSSGGGGSKRPSRTKRTKRETR